MNLRIVLLFLGPNLVFSRFKGGLSRRANVRANKLYSTQTFGEQLMTPGTQFMIDDLDQFDIVPSKNEGNFAYWDNLFDSGDLYEKVMTAEGTDAPLEYATSFSETDYPEMKTVMKIVPKTTSTLPLQILKVATAKKMQGETLALCHAVEVERYICHIPKEPVDVYTITVSPLEDPSVVETLWVARHHPQFEGALPECHVMNTGDVVVKGLSPKSTSNLRN